MDVFNSSSVFIENATKINQSKDWQIAYLQSQGCNLTIDAIKNESGRWMCYHQATTMEAIKMYWPELIILTLIAAYIGNKVMSYIIKKKFKKEKKE